MVTSKKTFSVVLHVDIATKLHELFSGKVGDERKYRNFGQAVNELIRSCLYVNQTIEGQYYNLSVRAAGENVIEIEDAHTNKIADVIIGWDQKVKRYRLYCRLDESFTCDHVGFAVVRPETRKLEGIIKLPRDKERHSPKGRLFPMITR